MALRPVAASIANKTVVTADIDNIVTLWAAAPGVEDGHAPPGLDHGDKALWASFFVGVFGRYRMHPAAGFGGRRHAEVRLLGDGSGR